MIRVSLGAGCHIHGLLPACAGYKWPRLKEHRFAARHGEKFLIQRAEGPYFVPRQTPTKDDRRIHQRQIDAINVHVAVSGVSIAKEKIMYLGNNTKTLLLVEDDDALRSRLGTAMQKRGFNITSASSVAEGLRAVRANAPDYAVIDLRLQDGSGLDVVEALEQQRPDARAIILTGYGNIPTAVAATRLGAIDYITKPATADEIVDTLMAPKGTRPPAPVAPLSPDDARFEHIEQVFHETGKNVSETARLLQMHRRTLQRILSRHKVVKDAA
jgi:two-component system response regulator RegA